MDDGTAAELTDDSDGDVMNAKQGSWGQAIVAALVVAVVTVGVTKFTDPSEETQTAAAIATLTERVSTLTEQVRRLNDQPYVRREELLNVESRTTGLERRVDQLEQRTGRQR